jgi:putative ABC transport system ATP-binding protein
VRWSPAGRSSGKSTLLNARLFDRPTRASTWCSVDTALLSESGATALRAREFVVFQSFHLLADRTAAENAELGPLYRGMGCGQGSGLRGADPGRARHRRRRCRGRCRAVSGSGR